MDAWKGSRGTQPLVPLVMVVGPTAVGKSQVAIRLAKALGTEVLAADSRQVYRGMDIGTDKPSVSEREGIPHGLIDLVNPDEPFNVGMYRRLALTEIDRIHRSGRVPLVVGGTGLYVRALIRGLWDGPSADWPFRVRMMEEARLKGPDHLHRELALVDPELAGGLHPHDEVKIVRGLEVYHLLGRPLSEVHRGQALQETPLSPLVIGLTRERSEVYRRTDARVEVELAKGLVRETQELLVQGYGRQLASMKGLGYRQIAAYLAGEHDFEEAVRRLKRDTRRFAKRQMTWFRKEPSVNWLPIRDGESVEQVAARIVKQVEDYLAHLSPRASISLSTAV